MKRLFEKTNKVVLLVSIIVIVILIITFILVFNNAKKNGFNTNSEGQKVNHPSTEDITEKVLNNTSTEELKDVAPLINMNDTQNVVMRNGEKVNSSEKLKEEKEVAGLKISNIVLQTRSGISVFNATVENTTDEDFEKRTVNLQFQQNDGISYITVKAKIPFIKAKGSATINTSTTKDIVNSYDVKFELE